MKILVRINGEERPVQGQTVADYLEKTGYCRTRVAVEKNGEILPKAEYDSTVLEDGDVIEVVSFVGGG
ncbi:sulfur carrier protein ThiS [Blautia glucerasea]